MLVKKDYHYIRIHGQQKKIVKIVNSNSKNSYFSASSNQFKFCTCSAPFLSAERVV